MAVKIVQKGKPTASVSDVLAEYQKKLGESVGSYGGLPPNAERIPTGLFPFDLATGGGFPRGRCSIVYGPEDSGKTSIAFAAIANHQRLWPAQTCVYIAIEPFDGPWAAKMGVDISKLVVLYPSYAEEVVDLAEKMLAAEDAGLVVVDSLAAMISTAEAEKSAEGNTPGGQGLVTGKLVRKTALALRDAEKAGRVPSLMYINQTRYKIGVMYGDPETMPGGQAPKFQAQLRVRFHGKAIKDSKISDTFPIKREITFMLKKAKIPIIADNGLMQMVTFPHNGFKIGEADDISVIEEQLKSFDAWSKGVTGKGWVILGELYPTQQAFIDRFRSDRKFAAELRQAIIERVLEDGDTLPIEPGGEINIDANGEIHEIPE